MLRYGSFEIKFITITENFFIAIGTSKSIITREFLGMTVPSTSTSSDTTRAKERIGDPSRMASDMAFLPTLVGYKVIPIDEGKEKAVEQDGKSQKWSCPDWG